MFDLKDPAGVLYEIAECRKVFGNCYIRVSAFDASAGLGIAAPVVHRQPAGGGARASAWSGTRRRGARSNTRCGPMPPSKPMGERY